MRATVLPLVSRPPTLAELELCDLEAVRLLLRGHSVVDWHRLSFEHHEHVDRFLRLNEFNPQAEDEMVRLEEIRHQAVEYLMRVHGFSLPEQVSDDVAARDLLLVASRQGPDQKWACVVLKTMHIMHHIAGRETLLSVSISDDAIFREIELKVLKVVEELRAAGAPISEFQWSRKSRDSQVTKLLAKRSTIAANIYDKLRFRLIVPHADDLLPTLVALTRYLVPFNYVVPGESLNQLIDLKHIVEHTGDLLPLAGKMQMDDEGAAERRFNEFSGAEYRIINFVADLPLRLDGMLAADEITPELSHVVFALTEFQICDRETARRNEQGDANHDLYKARQHDRVRRRLLRGEHDALPE